MSQYSAVKAIVNAYIRQNGRQEITGDILNSVLNATIDSLGKYFQFAGGASPTDDPGDPDQNLCYLASGPGIYTHFGNIVVDDEEVALLLYDGQWVKQSVLIGIKEVTASVDDGVGTPSVDVSYEEGTLVLTFHNLKGAQGVQGVSAGFGTVEANIGFGPYPGPRVFVSTSGPNTAKNISFDFVNIQGADGVSAGFGTVSASVGEETGTPSVTVMTSGPDTAKNITFAFDGLKGAKGDQGNSGYSGAAGELEVVNNLTDGGATAALSAEMGKYLKALIDEAKIPTEFATVDEDGIFFVDNYLNIGAKIDNDGIAAFNLLTMEDI